MPISRAMFFIQLFEKGKSLISDKKIDRQYYEYYEWTDRYYEWTDECNKWADKYYEWTGEYYKVEKRLL